MSNNKQSSVDAYCNGCNAFICDELVTFEETCSNCGTQIEYFEDKMSNNKQSMKLYTETDLIDLVQSLKDYTHESHSILGHDERDAKEFVDIFLKNRTPIEVPSDEEIVQDEEMYYIQNGFSGNAVVWWAKDSKGYTSNLNEAGKYTKEFAFNQVACGRSGEYAWPCSYVDGIHDKPICIFGSILNFSERIDYAKIQGGNQ